MNDRITWSNGSVWVRSVPELPYNWLFNGLSTRIEQTGPDLRVFNESGGSSRARFLSGTQIVALDWGNLIGTLSELYHRIDWSNRSVWVAPETSGPPAADVSGEWLFNGERTEIRQTGRTLTRINERGGASLATLGSDNVTITAANWNLRGQLDGNRIVWENSSQWIRAALAPPELPTTWTIQSRTARIESVGTELLLTNEWGGTTRARFNSPTEIFAIGWNLVGTLDNSNTVIDWANGSRWIASAGLSDTLFSQGFDLFN